MKRWKHCDCRLYLVRFTDNDTEHRSGRSRQGVGLPFVILLAKQRSKEEVVRQRTLQVMEAHITRLLACPFLRSRRTTLERSKSCVNGASPSTERRSEQCVEASCHSKGSSTTREGCSCETEGGDPDQGGEPAIVHDNNHRFGGGWIVPFGVILRVGGQLHP